MDSNSVPTTAEGSKQALLQYRARKSKNFEKEIPRLIFLFI